MQQNNKIRRLLTRDGKLDTVCKTTLNLHKGNIVSILTLSYEDLKRLERKPNLIKESVKLFEFTNKLELLQR